MLIGILTILGIVKSMENYQQIMKKLQKVG